MENHNGYQRHLILARLALVSECMEEDTSSVGEKMPNEINRLVTEFERLVTVALSRGFSREDFVELYGLGDKDQDNIVRDHMSESLVEAAIRAREDSLFDALVALVPEEIPKE